MREVSTRLLGIICLLSITVACAPDDAEQKRIGGLRSAFPNYSFDLNGIYLEARKQQGTVTNREAEAIFQRFWFYENSSAGVPTITYLNLYESDGRFAFQLY